MNRGKIIPKETRDKISKSSSGIRNHFYGKTHSKKNREKQRDRMVGKKMSSKIKQIMGFAQDIRWNKIPNKGISKHKMSGKYIVFGKKPGEKRRYLGLYKFLSDAKIAVKNYNADFTIQHNQ